jgi:acetylornithine/N-succinyldiaminopimelate aminotransferase
VTTDEVIQQYSHYVIGNYGRAPLVVTRAEGSRFWDIDGKAYIDLFPGWGCSLVGHCHPKVVAALREQAGRLIHIDNTFYTIEQGRLAEMLSERSFGGQCFFANSGAEANEAAIKIARRHTATGRYKIITMEKSFHGRTYGAMSATAQSKIHAGHEPLVPGFVHVPFNDVDAVRAAIDDETAAILVEPVQGEGGVNIPDDGYLPALRDLCDDNNMLLMLDEVQTGCGRTGKWFGYQHYDIEPDVITLAKGIAGGAPLGAMIARPEVAASMTPGSHATTFGANPLVVSAAIAMLEVVEEEGLLARAERVGQRIVTWVEAMRGQVSGIEGVRQRGVMIGIQLSVPGAPIVKAAMRRGLRANCTQDTVLRMLPAMNIPDADLDEGLTLLGEAMTEVESGLVSA